MTMMSAREIMDTYRPVYPGEHPNWADTLDHLASYPPDLAVVTALRGYLTKDGGFREEVVLETQALRSAGLAHHTALSSSSDTVPLFLLNGTHRVAAAFLENPDLPIAVHHKFPEETLPDHVEGYPEGALTSSVALNDDLSGEEREDILETLRSLEVSDTLWVTADGMSISGADLDLVWGFGDERDVLKLNEHDYTAISQAIVIRLKAEGLEDFSVNTYFDRDDEYDG